MAECANHLGMPATAVCRRCESPICDACKEMLDGQPYCASCVKALQRKLGGEAASPVASAAAPAGVAAARSVPAPIEPPSAPVSPKAIAGAIGGGLAGALLWYAIVAMTDYKLGIVAVGVGWLVGRGALLGNGGRGGKPLAVASLVIALGSMLLGEYLSVNHVVHRVLAERQPGVSLPAFISPGMFASVYGGSVGPLDLIFYVIGALQAWRHPARAK